MSQNQYISIGDVARQTSLSKTQVRRAVLAGEIPAFKLPGQRRWLIPQSAVDEWL